MTMGERVAKVWLDNKKKVPFTVRHCRLTTRKSTMISLANGIDYTTDRH